MEINRSELPAFLSLLYADTGIPVSLYERGTFTLSFPDASAIPHVPLQYREKVSFFPYKICLVSTNYGVFYGALKLTSPLMRSESEKPGDGGILFLGPVCSIPYSMADLRLLFRDYLIAPEDQEAFRSILETIPSMSDVSLIHKLIFLDYCLNKELVPAEEMLSDYLKSSKENSKIRNEKPDTDLYPHNESWKIEQQIRDLIRSGNIEGFQKLRYHDEEYHYGVLAGSAVRHLRDQIIVVTTISTRAAIEGGLDYDTAYQMSDQYIRLAETLTKAEDLTRLLGQVSYSFAEKVHEARIPVTSNEILEKAIQYIVQNTDRKISVADVAQVVGFSRSYFSSWFKSEMGFSVSAFILRSKLEEAKMLLQSTDRSLADISNYLCFSSQSHFQTAFKRQFGVTPQQHRKNPKKF